MAKVKFDLKSLEIPTAVQQPLYAGVGAGDLAYTAVKEYVADVQRKLTEVQKDAKTRVDGVQKTVADFDPKSARKQAADAVAARRSAVEARVADLQNDAKALPAKVQTVVNDNVTTVTSTYADLARRGEALVRGTKLPSSVSAEVKVNPTHPGARKAAAKKPAARKTTTRKPAAKKATAKKA